MKLKGIDKFLAKIPKFSGNKIILFPIYIIVVIFTSIFIQLTFDRLPSQIPASGGNNYILALLPVFGVLLIGLLGLILVYQMWYYRNRLKAKYGELAYQKIFLVGFAGIVLLISIPIHNYLSNFIWNDSINSPYLYIILSNSLTNYIVFGSSIFFLIRILIGFFFLMIAFLMFYRSFTIFGFDYMVVLYLYFPEESELQDHEIYNLLRHPTYAALIVLCFGGMILQLNLYSIIDFIIYYIIFYIHVHFVEEKELIQRFGDSYNEYRKKVPAFFVKPKKLKSFLKILLFNKQD